MHAGGEVDTSKSSEEVVETLRLAIQAVFSEWSALNMAVENDWGGSSSRDKALSLMQRITTGMISSVQIYPDEIESVLEEALIDDFNVEAEDDSPAQVARLLCSMHREARSGCISTAMGVIERAATRRGNSNWTTAPLPPGRAKAGDSSDDSGSGDSDDAMGDVGDSGVADGECSDERAVNRPMPVVDGDGFQVVTRSRSRRG